MATTPTAPSARYRHALRVVLAAESKAYGFTLTVWASGALTAAEHGSPKAGEVIAFAGGALVAIGAVIALSYRSPNAELQSHPVRQYAAGAVHVASVGLAIPCAWLVAAPFGDAWLAYGSAGLAASITYQLVVGLEVLLSAEE